MNKLFFTSSIQCQNLLSNMLPQAHKPWDAFYRTIQEDVPYINVYANEQLCIYSQICFVKKFS